MNVPALFLETATSGSKRNSMHSITVLKLVLKYFRVDVMETHGALAAMKEDELAKFGPEDFRRMEREERAYFKRKKRKEARK